MVRGIVMRVDRFGNLITNITRATLEALTPPLAVTLDRTSPMPVVGTYSDVAPGELCALVGSSGHLEIAVSQGSAAERLAGGRGRIVTVSEHVTIPGCHDEF